MSDDLRRRSMRIFSHVKRSQNSNDDKSTETSANEKPQLNNETNNNGDHKVKEVSDTAQQVDSGNQPKTTISPKVGDNSDKIQSPSRSSAQQGISARSRLIAQTHSQKDKPVYALPRVISIANQKGGVGKTTTSVNLGASIAESGGRVLIIDLDPQGNATTGLGIQHRDLEGSVYDVIINDKSLDDCTEPTSVRNLFVVPATIDLAGAEIELVPAFSREMKLKRAISEVKDQYDYILIDCPPSLGLLTVNALAASDDVVVPIQCEYYALEGLSQLINNVNLVQSNLNADLTIRGILLTMYDARTKLAEQVEIEVREHFGAQVYATVIPRTVRLSEAPSFGQPITTFDPTSRGAIAYRELAKEIRNGETERIG